MSNYKPVFLWGMPGVGKSTLGKKIAKYLNWDWIDLDEYITHKYNASIGQIVKDKGQDYFREIEHKSLLEIIENKNTIIACGGGTPIYFDNANLMRVAGLCIYLKADIKFIVARITQSKQERFLFQNLEDEALIFAIEELFNARKDVFEQAEMHLKIPLTAISEEIESLKKHLKLA